MPGKSSTKQSTKGKEGKENKETKEPKSSSKKSTKSKRSMLDDDSDNDFSVSNTINSGKKGKKILGEDYKMEGESDFEPLEPWDDAGRGSKSKSKRVKKESVTTKSGRASVAKSQATSTPQNKVSNSTQASVSRSDTKKDQKETREEKKETKEKKDTKEKKETKKGTPKGKESAQNIIVKMNTEEQDIEEGVFHNDENPQFDESSAFIPLFLQENHIRDMNGKYQTDDGYDPTTLYVPPEEFKKARPVMKQYWAMKSQHNEKLVGIKVWKFYYFYFHDALVVHRICDMKVTITNNSTYTFFHEAVMARFAPKLLAAGYKIVIIEQMEEHAKEENEVIRREICQILTRGTAVENQELDYSSRFLLAIYEEDLNFGVVFVDTTTHEFHIGEFRDDSHRSNLRTLVTRTKPVEIVYLRSYIEQETLSLLRGISSKPVLSMISFNEPRHFHDVFDTLEYYFTSQEDKKVHYPELLNTIFDSIQLELKKERNLEGLRLFEFEKKIPFFATIQALSICTDYLKNVLLDETVISMGNFTPYNLTLEKKATLYLDSQALENLEVLEVQYLNVLSESNSLFGYMDMTVSQFGKRMLKRWVASPLIDAEMIKERQNAISDLLSNSDVIKQFQDKLEKLPDIERMINKIYNLNNKQRLSAIYFEDFAKNRLKDFLAFLGELKKVDGLIEIFLPYLHNFQSKRLLQLTAFREIDIKQFIKKKSLGKRSLSNKIEEELEEENINGVPYIEGIFPKIHDIVSDLEAMVLIKDGLPIPAPGVNKENDEIMAKIEEVKTSLQTYLEQQRKKFCSNDIKYVHTKHRYELEIPEKLVDGSKRPKDFSITSKKKGYLRFHSPEIENCLRKLWHYEHDFQKVLIPFICDYFKKFYERNSYWQQVINYLGELDCLCSLARLANTMSVRCLPEVFPMSDRPIFELKEMIHPMVARNNPNFVPNDVIVENDVDIFLITGPNMGGKSTLLRQTCLAVIMAQVGSFIPAKSFKLSAIDRIFTRIGASDRILEGKSTFFIELEETYNIVQEATKNSLLIIDELGRGTSTYDGVSIAYATLKYIAERIKCISLFATHYHLLLEEFKLYKNIDSYFMQSELNEKHDEIKFLYKFGKGQASKSHGIVIAKVAGLPDSVISLAKTKAAFMTNEKRNLSFERNLMEKFNKIIDEAVRIEQGDLLDPDVLLNELNQLQ